MAMIRIVQNGDPVLRTVARDVLPQEFNTPAFRKIIEDMRKALYSQNDGVAIAAPQIGIPLRIFLVSGQAIDANRRVKVEKPTPDSVYVNPQITKLSKETKWVAEGCLSVRYLYGKVLRSTRAMVEAYNEHGEKFSRGGSGLLAQIFQHEIDHLDGVLFIDKAKEIEDIPPEA